MRRELYRPVHAKTLRNQKAADADVPATVRVRLLDRSARGIEPTIYANVLLKRGHAVLDELKQGIKEIEFLSDPTAGEIRIGCAEILSYGLLPAVIDRLSRRHPQVAVRVVHLNTESLEFQVLQERTVDPVIARVSVWHRAFPMMQASRSTRRSCRVCSNRMFASKIIAWVFSLFR